MRDRLTAWNYGGKTCPACGFEGAMLFNGDKQLSIADKKAPYPEGHNTHVERRKTCVCCGLSLVYCPKCGKVECLGSGNNNFVRHLETQPEEVITGLLPVKPLRRRKCRPSKG